MRKKFILLVCVIFLILSCFAIYISKNKVSASEKDNIFNKIQKSKHTENSKSNSSKKENDIKDKANITTEDEIRNDNLENKDNKSNNAPSKNDNAKEDNSKVMKSITHNDGKQPANTITKSENKISVWEKLGITENEYYNSPAPNEGELAFRDSETKCDQVENEITNKYTLVTHSGDVKSYSEKYLGCWITIYLPNNKWMFYNEFKLRESKGEFKKYERTTQ